MALQSATRSFAQARACIFSMLGAISLLAMWHPIARAQEAKPSPNGAAQIPSQNSADQFILGRLVEVKRYNPSEAVQWGFDFVISPSNAKDRVVLYAYDIQKADAEFFRKLENIVLEKQPLIAVISSPFSNSSDKSAATKPASNRPNMASGRSDFAIPIILDAKNKSFVSSFISTLADRSKAARIIPALITVSSLKSQGIDWEGTSPQRASLEQEWSGFIASSIPVSDHLKPVVYIGPKSGWDVSTNLPNTMATQSELQRWMIKYNVDSVK